MKLPNAQHVVIEIKKLTEYCLSPEHPRGKHKAHVFAAVCGITAENKESFSMRCAMLPFMEKLDLDWPMTMANVS